MIKFILIFLTTYNALVFDFSNKQDQQRCFFYRNKSGDGEIQIDFRILSRVQKGQMIYKLFDQIQGKELDLTHYLQQRDKQQYRINLPQNSKAYKLCFLLAYFTEPINIELNRNFKEKLADKKQLTKSVYLISKIQKQADKMKIQLESDYFILKEKKNRLDSSQRNLTYATGLKIWLIIVVAAVQGILFSQQLKKQKYSKV